VGYDSHFCISPETAGWGWKWEMGHQDPRHKFGCDIVHAHFFHQNPLACLITNSHLLSNVVNGPTSFLTDELWFHATVSGVIQLVVYPVHSSSSTDVWPVFNRACHWNPCVRLKIWSPKACWIIVRVFIALHSNFPKIGTKFDAHSFPSLIHCENCHRLHTWLQINANENCPCSYVQLGIQTH
jgi:hypothetical protein